MKVLKHGNRYNKTRKFTCHSCWCEFEAERGEYKDDVLKSGDKIHPALSCQCPECGNLITKRLEEFE